MQQLCKAWLARPICTEDGSSTTFYLHWSLSFHRFSILSSHNPDFKSPYRRVPINLGDKTVADCKQDGNILFLEIWMCV